jgi:predicted RNA-binding protein with PIN domain
MPYLVDGHNLIPKLGLSLSAIDDELELIDWLRAFCQQKRKDIEVFFDQAPVGVTSLRRYGRVTAHFVRQGSTADAAIYTRLQQLGKGATSYIVVSSDRQVQAYARGARARILTSEAFARELTELPQGSPARLPGDRGITADEIEDWEALFNRRSDGSDLTKP